MTFSKSFVVKKLEELTGYLREIDNLFKLSDKKITSDSGKLHIAERLLQLAVDTMIDINQHFIKELELEISEDFQGTFYELSKNKIIPLEFAKKIAPSVGLRNRVVHRYESLDKQLFVSTFRKHRDDFKKYCKFITKRLAKMK